MSESTMIAEIGADPVDGGGFAFRAGAASSYSASSHAAKAWLQSGSAQTPGCKENCMPSFSFDAQNTDTSSMPLDLSGDEGTRALKCGWMQLNWNLSKRSSASSESSTCVRFSTSNASSSSNGDSTMTNVIRSKR